ncbi:MAG: ABC transporter ATP-binding protein/permease, partial [Rhodocyclaceae bacterium]|nr:ABC transporter ATP-binding protein/permease [Rhodocyclaceae bacterium]
MKRTHYNSLPSGPDPAERRDWATVQSLLPYLLEWKWRIFFALACLVAAKLANVAAPFAFKGIVDTFTPLSSLPSQEQVILLVPAGLLAAYGLARFSSSLFTELREIIFARVTQRAVRSIALQVFEHLHSLSMRFHLERQTGGLTRDIERGTRAIGSLISYMVYSILPTLIEILLVLGILIVRYDSVFAWITCVTLVVYIAYTIAVTNWRTHIRREANEIDSTANSRAIDSLLNYETVKYFNNERWEFARYDAQMQRWESAMVKTQVSLAWLNLGQATIIACAATAMMWRASQGVVNGSMTVGDIVLVNAFLIQLYVPLNYLGVLYREIRQSLTDIERMFALLHQNREVRDPPDATELTAGPCEVSFDQVSFSYNDNRPILFDVSFTIPPGRTLAVVGQSGSGKSTLARLLFRFYDINAGTIRIKG